MECQFAGKVSVVVYVFVGEVCAVECICIREEDVGWIVIC